MVIKWTLVVLISLISMGSEAQPMPPGATLRGDSATLPASLKYSKPSFFKRLFLGKNYRTAWATPITLPVFHLKEMGLTIKELGGGQQTKSLRLLDNTNHEWALRTIDKDVEKALSPRMQNTLAERVVQDMISGAHPYAPLTIPTIAKAADINTADPIFFYIPDDPALGEFNAIFKNSICMLEDREPTPDRSDTKNTLTFVEAILKNNNVQVDEEAVLRARLLDMLIGDWDRHQDQWRWDYKKINGINYGYAIPRDRDQAYFYSKGLLVKVARMIAMKHLVGFAWNTSKLKKLNAKSWNFDRTFLNDLDAEDWERVIDAFVAALPDETLHQAVKKMPPEVYPLHGPQIEKKLINRRNCLKKDALKYQRFLAAHVTIAGTDEADRFNITTTKDSISITQHTGTDFSDLVYQRTFYRAHTYEISIIGLDGNDEFIQSGTSTKIRLNLDGGKGKNKYEVAEHRKTKIQDSEMDAKMYTNILKKTLKIKD